MDCACCSVEVPGGAFDEREIVRVLRQLHLVARAQRVPMDQLEQLASGVEVTCPQALLREQRPGPDRERQAADFLLEPHRALDQGRLRPSGKRLQMREIRGSACLERRVAHRLGQRQCLTSALDRPGDVSDPKTPELGEPVQHSSAQPFVAM